MNEELIIIISIDIIKENKKYKIYSENNEDNLDDEIISNFVNKRIKGIIGIFVFSKRINIITRLHFLIFYNIHI